MGVEVMALRFCLRIVVFIDLHLETCMELSSLLAADALHGLLYYLFLHGNDPIEVTPVVNYEIGFW